MKIRSPVFHNIINKHGSRKWMNRLRIQGVNRNIPKMFQIAPCVKSVRFWKFHKYRFNRFSAILLIVMDSSEKVEQKFLCSRGLMEYPENVPNCSLYQAPPTLQISWKSVQPFFRNVANRQTDKQTNPGNRQRWKHNRHGGGKYGYDIWYTLRKISSRFMVSLKLNT